MLYIIYIKRIKEQLLYCITMGILYHHNLYYKKPFLILHIKKIKLFLFGFFTYLFEDYTTPTIT